MKGDQLGLVVWLIIQKNIVPFFKLLVTPLRRLYVRGVRCKELGTAVAFFKGHRQSLDAQSFEIRREKIGTERGESLPDCNQLMAKAFSLSKKAIHIVLVKDAWNEDGNERGSEDENAID